MGKRFQSMQNWGEVAPAALSRKSSRVLTKLETIIEEGSESSFEGGQKGMSLYVLPLLLTGFMYIMLYTDVA
ncbi:unnamed protein product [Prunus armeniaca]|uniref:Uncharacterized protein n=1 Tax=Prunus armeniaca TaxID=36596 RepID=A0A6J5X714_PRUAR|nr:unnamed protein product [Prunus armeniaca]CAB4306884.1 unnamed protein product [Prunus armeniaca]